jgi:hypothetical protein
MAGSTAKLNPFSTIAVPDSGIISNSDIGNTVEYQSIVAGSQTILPWKPATTVLPALFAICATADRNAGFYMLGTATAGTVLAISGFLNGTSPATTGFSMDVTGGNLILYAGATLTTCKVTITKLT